MVLTAAASALSSIKAAYDIAKGALAFKVSTEVRIAISDMLDKLMEAKVKAHEAFEKEQALLKRVAELEEENRRIKTVAADLENYEPKKFHPGVTAYVLKPALAAGKHPHKLCANCYAHGEKSELQATAKTESRYRQHICPSCKTEYYMGGEMAAGSDPDPPPPSMASIKLIRS
jgi:hypothetical protein